MRLDVGVGVVVAGLVDAAGQSAGAAPPVAHGGGGVAVVGDVGAAGDVVAGLDRGALIGRSAACLFRRL